MDPRRLVPRTDVVLTATLTAVINATGVLLHTSLGRAPLSTAAREAVAAAAGSTDVEFDQVRSHLTCK